jgi:four helix bundle protein
MVAKRFEDLIFWQRARELTKLIYTYAQKGEFKKDFGLKEQIQRSSVSVMSNIAEGFGRGSNKEFVQFLFIAKGSLAEVQAQLYLAEDLGYICNADFKKAYGVTKEISLMINSFVKKIKAVGKQGLKER